MKREPRSLPSSGTRRRAYDGGDNGEESVRTRRPIGHHDGKFCFFLTNLTDFGPRFGNASTADLWPTHTHIRLQHNDGMRSVHRCHLLQPELGKLVLHRVWLTWARLTPMISWTDGQTNQQNSLRWFVREGGRGQESQRNSYVSGQDR